MGQALDCCRHTARIVYAPFTAQAYERRVARCCFLASVTRRKRLREDERPAQRWLRGGASPIFAEVDCWRQRLCLRLRRRRREASRPELLLFHSHAYLKKRRVTYAIALRGDAPSRQRHRA